MNLNDNEDEGYLDPNELEIIEDNWEPTDEDILAYAMKLGFDIENDPDELFEIAYYFLKHPLPKGWKRAIYKETGEIMYINMEDGEIEIATEIEEKAHELYVKRKEEMMKKAQKSSAEKEESSGVVPRVKIKPINKSQNSASNRKPETKEVAIGLQTHNDDESENISFIDNNNENENDNLGDDISGISADKSDKSSGLNEGKILPNRKFDVEKMKKEYFEEKLKELKEFEVELRDKYTKEKNEYKEKKAKLKKELEEENTKKLNEYKEKLSNQYKDKLDLYSTQLKRSNELECEKYKKSLEKENPPVDNKMSPEASEEIKELTLEKAKLLNNVKNKKLDKKLMRSQEIENKKQKVKTDSDLRKSKLDIQFEKKVTDLTRELEDELDEVKQKQKKVLTQSLSVPIEIPNQILDEYRKQLDEQYKDDIKVISNTVKKNNEKELEDFSSSMVISKNSRISQYTKEISSLEKEYYNTISILRKESNDALTKLNEEMKKKFNLTLTQYDSVKQKIVQQGNECIENANKNLVKIICENDVSKTEMKYEEYLYDAYDKFMIQFTRNKNDFEIGEADFIYKKTCLDFVLEVLQYVNKTIIDNCIDVMNGKSDAADLVLKFIKEKNEQYKFIYNNNKENHVFPFVYQADFIQNLNRITTRHTTSLPRDINEKITLKNYNNRPMSERYEQIENLRETVRENEEEKMSTNYYPPQGVRNSNANLNTPDQNEEDINAYVIDENSSLSIPLLPEQTLSQLNEDSLGLYSDIIVFLKDEYIKMNELTKKGGDTKLNMLILDKIKIYTEDTFHYIQLNIRTGNQNIFKEKLNLLTGNISDYKKHFGSLPISYSYKPKVKKVENEEMPKKSTNFGMSMTTNSFSLKNKYLSDFKAPERDLKMSYYPSTYSKDSTFDNFLSQYNSGTSLNKTLSTPFTHEFFNYKKNKKEIDTKLMKYK